MTTAWLACAVCSRRISLDRGPARAGGQDDAEEIARECGSELKRWVWRPLLAILVIDLAILAQFVLGILHGLAGGGSGRWPELDLDTGLALSAMLVAMNITFLAQIYAAAKVAIWRVLGGASRARAFTFILGRVISLPYLATGWLFAFCVSQPSAVKVLDGFIWPFMFAFCYLLVSGVVTAVSAGLALDGLEDIRVPQAARQKPG